MLSPDFPGAAELRLQVPFATVVATCECGCPTVDLAVDRGRAEPADCERVLPVEGDIHGLGGIIIFTKDGVLSLLELWWIDAYFTPMRKYFTTLAEKKAKAALAPKPEVKAPVKATAKPVPAKTTRAITVKTARPTRKPKAAMTWTKKTPAKSGGAAGARGLAAKSKPAPKKAAKKKR